MIVKNPEQPSPPEVGLGEEQQPEFPVDLSAHFRKRRFAPADPPDFLDVEGTEIILIGADEDVRGELGISLDPERETMDTAEIFRDLHMEKSKHPLEPLFQGKWV